jgi:dTDP-4-dehydrorhamnose reductase
MSQVVVFGGNGQLGKCLQEVVKGQGANGWAYRFLSAAEADITDSKKLESLFLHNKPSYVINCAAYTAVDLAEDEIEKARAINATAVEVLAQLCKTHDATLIHISTDFVFDGTQSTPYKEADAVAPIGNYGLTKLEGEKAVSQQCEKHFIIRTSWLYSEFGNNFHKTMLRIAQGRESISVVADQIGTPTYAMDLAAFIIHVIQSDSRAYGVYHFSNQGVASWYDFACEILRDQVGLKIVPINTAAYPTKAKRPAYSVLDKSKITHTFSYEIPYWRDSLEVCKSRSIR